MPNLLKLDNLVLCLLLWQTEAYTVNSESIKSSEAKFRCKSRLKWAATSRTVLRLLMDFMKWAWILPARRKSPLECVFVSMNRVATWSFSSVCAGSIQKMQFSSHCHVHYWSCGRCQWWMYLIHSQKSREQVIVRNEIPCSHQGVCNINLYALWVYRCFVSEPPCSLDYSGQLQSGRWLLETGVKAPVGLHFSVSCLILEFCHLLFFSVYCVKVRRLIFKMTLIQYFNSILNTYY